MSRPYCEGCGKVSRTNDLGLCVECHEDELFDPYGTISEYEGYLPKEEPKDN